MKKSPLLNAALSQVIASLGHGDMLVIGDAGLPVPHGVPVIDLALTRGIPGFMDTLRIVLGEMEVESHVLADETLATSPAFAAGLSVFDLPLRSTMNHDAFKHLSKTARAVVRTGECTPYANIILVAGVAF